MYRRAVKMKSQFIVKRNPVIMLVGEARVIGLFSFLWGREESRELSFTLNCE